MGGFIVPIIDAVNWLLTLYFYLVIAMAIMSWLIAFGVVNTYNRTVARIIEFLYRVTDPALRPIRRIVPSFGGIDISPIILFAIIYVVQGWLTHLSYSLRYGF